MDHLPISIYPLKSSHLPFRAFLSDFRHFPDAVPADVFPVEVHKPSVRCAENAGRLKFAQNNPVPLHEDLQLIPLRNIQRAAQLNGKHDPSQVIHLADNTC